METKHPNLLPLSAMARRLNVRPRDLRAEVEAGALPAIRVGEAYLFDPAAVEAALLARARDGSEARHG